MSNNQKQSKLQVSRDELYDEETRLLRSMTPVESLHLLVRMQSAFEHQLQKSASSFESHRRKQLVDLQARLRRLVS